MRMKEEAQAKALEISYNLRLERAEKEAREKAHKQSKAKQNGRQRKRILYEIEEQSEIEKLNEMEAMKDRALVDESRRDFSRENEEKNFLAQRTENQKKLLKMKQSNKLRMLVIKVMNKGSYGFHPNKLFWAMRMWKEAVSESKKIEQLDNEISRISAQ